MLRFGTDGVRARAYEDLFPEDFIRLAQAAAEVLAPTNPVIIGRDTRHSSPDFANALMSGFSAVGVSTINLGIAPTPAVAWAAAHADTLGVMVSASHNPWRDNGLKLFNAEGLKLQDEVQAALEATLANDKWQPVSTLGVPNRAFSGADLLQQYQHDLTNSVSFSTHNLKVVVDAANGAVTPMLPEPLTAHGINVITINTNPDGKNINRKCGSTYHQTVARAVIANKADLGLTFDGDADRVLAVDHTGELIDGDQIIAICAVDRQQRNALADNTVVVTVMTNLGFHRAMAQRNIVVVTTPVGDRNVLAALQKYRWGLGGEQSGHVIFPELATTGDGMITALQLLEVIARHDISLQDIAKQAMTKMPQVLHNVKIGPTPIDEAVLQTAVTSAEQTLNGSGRVLVRPSGTEPVIRIMVEADTPHLAESVASNVAAAINQ